MPAPIYRFLRRSIAPSTSAKASASCALSDVRPATGSSSASS
jgi:hypothetical protein